MSLKQKTISGLSWSFIDRLAGQGIAFIIGIILARILTPREFGLIGMITIFIAVSETFIESGFSQAIIRKKDCTAVDMSTVFYFNLAIGSFFYLTLFFTAPYISFFFNEPQLKNIIRVFGLVLIIDSFTIIQNTILTKRIDFKMLTKISVISNTSAGVIGIFLAFHGFGVWSLVAKTLFQRLIRSVLLWFGNRWKPLLVFSKNSFKELFSFGSKLLISRLIDTIFQNIYYLVIGKYFSSQDLGYYTRADQFKNLPSKNLNQIISRVSYPVLSQLQDNNDRVKAGYKKLLKGTMFITFILMLGMAAIAEPMIMTLLGQKWQPSIILLQMLCFIGMLYPLQALNLNILKVKGRSDLFLKLEIIKKILVVGVVIIGISYGIKIMIVSMIINSFISYFINSYWSARLINYPVMDQLIDITPSFLFAGATAIILFAINSVLSFSYLINLIILLLSGFVLTVIINEIFKIEPYIMVKSIVKEKVIYLFHVKK